MKRFAEKLKVILDMNSLAAFISLHCNIPRIVFNACDKENNMLVIMAQTS